ncbi:MAG: hypothetical protein CM15mP102_17680 [Flavobacteriales bacterium]|nr:MAG: hypothetical protein CM15mP102_17680 [Flavobacteriales bacterium]
MLNNSQFFIETTRLSISLLSKVCPWLIWINVNLYLMIIEAINSIQFLMDKSELSVSPNSASRPLPSTFLFFQTFNFYLQSHR